MIIMRWQHFHVQYFIRKIGNSGHLFPIYSLCVCFNYFVGDLPLCNEARKRLRRIKGRVIEILDTSYKLLAYLYQEHVIGEIDYHNLRNESEMTNRNAMLMDIIMRGSERGFACFCDSLSSDVNQAYLVPCLQRGIQSILHSNGTIYRIVSNIVILRSYRGISLSR